MQLVCHERARGRIYLCPPFHNRSLSMRQAMLGSVAGLLAGAVRDSQYFVATNSPSRPMPRNRLPVIVEEDFENGMDRWQTTDPDPADSVWK